MAEREPDPGELDDDDEDDANVLGRFIVERATGTLDPDPEEADED